MENEKTSDYEKKFQLKETKRLELLKELNALMSIYLDEFDKIEKDIAQNDSLTEEERFFENEKLNDFTVYSIPGYTKKKAEYEKLRTELNIGKS